MELKVRLRVGNTYLLQWNIAKSAFNRFFYKIVIKRTMQKSKDVCDFDWFFLIFVQNLTIQM